jgi:hypothetical protein
MFAFKEAVGSCKNANYLASAVMSRTVLEAMLYLAMIFSIDLGGQPVIEGKVLKLLSTAIFPWGRLKKWAKDKLVLDKKLLSEADEVRQLGNFAAHYAEQVMRGAAGDPMKPYRVSVLPEEAYRALNITSQFVLSVAERWNQTMKMSEPESR